MWKLFEKQNNVTVQNRLTHVEVIRKTKIVTEKSNSLAVRTSRHYDDNNCRQMSSQHTEWFKAK